MSDDKPFQCTAPGCGQVSEHKSHFVPQLLLGPKISCWDLVVPIRCGAHSLV